MATHRQKLVAQKLVENGGKQGKAMMSAGYSSATAKTPQILTESKGWKELMVLYFSDNEVRRTLKTVVRNYFKSNPSEMVHPPDTILNIRRDREWYWINKERPGHKRLGYEKISQLAKTKNIIITWQGGEKLNTSHDRMSM